LPWEEDFSGKKIFGAEGEIAKGSSSTSRPPYVGEGGGEVVGGKEEENFRLKTVRGRKHHETPNGDKVKKKM